MNILIVGCGDTGSRLANIFDKLGHDVSVVDRQAENAAALGDDFGGLFTVGVPIDQDVLRHAGIQGCDAVITATKDDNINLMVSQLAKDIFGVARVISRVSDPQREEVFSSFGLATVCPTNLTVDSVVSAISGNRVIEEIVIGSSIVALEQVALDNRYIGKTMDNIPVPPSSSIVGLLAQNGKLRLFAPGIKCVIQEGDTVVFAKIIGDGARG